MFKYFLKYFINWYRITKYCHKEVRELNKSQPLPLKESAERAKKIANEHNVKYFFNDAIDAIVFYHLKYSALFLPQHASSEYFTYTKETNTGTYSIIIHKKENEKENSKT